MLYACPVTLNTLIIIIINQNRLLTLILPTLRIAATWCVTLVGMILPHLSEANPSDTHLPQLLMAQDVFSH